MRITCAVDLERHGCVVVTADVSLPSLPDPCLDHDSSSYADAGDPGEVGLVSVVDEAGRDVRADLSTDDERACVEAAMCEVTA